MNNNRSGISVVSVLIVLVIISILTGAISISVETVIENTYKKEFVREYNLVKSATKDYIMRNSDIIDFTESEFDVSEIETKYLEQFGNETIVNNKFTVYIIDLEKVGVFNTTYGLGSYESDDVYVLSKETREVYYKKGFVEDEYKYYKGIND